MLQNFWLLIKLELSLIDNSVLSYKQGDQKTKWESSTSILIIINIWN